MNGEIINIKHLATGLTGVLVQYFEGFTKENRLAHLKTKEGFSYFAPVTEFIMID